MMALDVEQITTKLAVFESQMSTLLQSNLRIEQSLERLGILDKTLSEIVQRNAYLTEKLIEVSKEVEKCAKSHEIETSRLWVEVTTLKDKANRAHGVSIGAIALLGIIASIATYFLTFLFTTANENKAARIQQHEKIQHIERTLEKEKNEKDFRNN